MRPPVSSMWEMEFEMHPVIASIGYDEQQDWMRVSSKWRSLTVVREFSSFSELIAANAAGFEPQWIVLWQSRPDSSDCAHVDLLHRTWPLARVVAVLGEWSAREVDRVSSSSGVHRIHWREANVRFGQWLSTSPAIGLPPPTSNRVDQMMIDADIVDATAAQMRTISTLLLCQDKTSRESLEFAFARLGWRITPCVTDRSSCDVDYRRDRHIASTEADLLIWQPKFSEFALAENGQQEIYSRSEQWRRENPRLAIVVITDFPQAEFVSRMEALDKLAVIARPFSFVELALAAKRLVATCETSSPQPINQSLTSSSGYAA